MDARSTLSATWRVAMQCLPMRKGEPCGDAAAHHAWTDADGDTLLLAIVDGLGHGAPAAQAAEAALRVIAEQPRADLPALMAQLDAGLAATRGAAVGLARVEGTRLRYAGVGNTRALRWRGGQMTRLSSQYGVVGGGMPSAVQVSELDIATDDWLLLFTDGLDEMLSLPAHLPEWDREPALLCDHLLARWRLARDDGGVLVAHCGPINAPEAA